MAEETARRSRAGRMSTDDWAYLKRCVDRDIKDATREIAASTDEAAARYIDELENLIHRRARLHLATPIDKPRAARRRGKKEEGQSDAPPAPPKPPRRAPKESLAQSASDDTSSTEREEPQRGSEERTMLMRVDSVVRNCSGIGDEQFNEIIAKATDDKHTTRESLDGATLSDLTAVHRALLQYM
jgi:hypothetical protein